MQELTPFAADATQSLAQRYGVSVDAVRALLYAVSAGGGTMAQFYHPDLGGGGQWMQGGMTMVGDMFNHGLQATVSGLCSELSRMLNSQQMFVPLPRGNGNFGHFGNAWWPAELGNPSSSGGQNDSRYAYFPGTQRLAIERNGQVTLYNTLDHQIGGVQQQQGGNYGSLSFSSQFGTFTVDSLPLVNAAYPEPAPMQSPAFAPAPYQPAPPQWTQPQPSPAQFSGSTSAQSHDEILATLERLSDLHQRGVLSEAEFQAKKSDLLARL